MARMAHRRISIELRLPARRGGANTVNRHFGIVSGLLTTRQELRLSLSTIRFSFREEKTQESEEVLGMLAGINIAKLETR